MISQPSEYYENYATGADTTTHANYRNTTRTTWHTEEEGNP